jgi:hypothetical protein
VVRVVRKWCEWFSQPVVYQRWAYQAMDVSAVDVSSVDVSAAGVSAVGVTAIELSKGVRGIGRRLPWVPMVAR